MQILTAINLLFKGMSKLPKSFWKKSIFQKKNKMACQAAAVDVGQGDVRYTKLYYIAWNTRNNPHTVSYALLFLDFINIRDVTTNMTSSPM